MARRRTPPEGPHCGANVFNDERVHHVMPRRYFDSHGFFCFLTRIGLHNSTPPARLAEAVSLAMAREPSRRRSMRSKLFMATTLPVSLRTASKTQSERRCAFSPWTGSSRSGLRRGIHCGSGDLIQDPDEIFFCPYGPDDRVRNLILRSWSTGFAKPRRLDGDLREAATSRGVPTFKQPTTRRNAPNSAVGIETNGAPVLESHRPNEKGSRHRQTISRGCRPST